MGTTGLRMAGSGDGADARRLLEGAEVRGHWSALRGPILRTRQGRCPLDPHQGQWPLVPFNFVGVWVRAKPGRSRFGSALLKDTAKMNGSPTNGQLASKGKPWPVSCPEPLAHLDSRRPPA